MIGCQCASPYPRRQAHQTPVRCRVGPPTLAAISMESAKKRARLAGDRPNLRVLPKRQALIGQCRFEQLPELRQREFVAPKYASFSARSVLLVSGRLEPLLYGDLANASHVQRGQVVVILDANAPDEVAAVGARQFVDILEDGC